ncbi:uncharacterized [Tachysurus ichikawai]
MLSPLYVPEHPDSAPILLLNKNRQGLGQDMSCGKVIFKRHASEDKAGMAPGYTNYSKTPTSGLPPLNTQQRLAVSPSRIQTK